MGKNQEFLGNFDIYRTSDFDFNIFLGLGTKRASYEFALTAKRTCSAIFRCFFLKHFAG